MVCYLYQSNISLILIVSYMIEIERLKFLYKTQKISTAKIDCFSDFYLKSLQHPTSLSYILFYLFIHLEIYDCKISNKQMKHWI